MKARFFMVLALATVFSIGASAQISTDTEGPGNLPAADAPSGCTVKLSYGLRDGGVYGHGGAPGEFEAKVERALSKKGYSLSAFGEHSLDFSFQLVEEQGFTVVFEFIKDKQLVAKSSEGISVWDMVMNKAYTQYTARSTTSKILGELVKKLPPCNG